MKKIFIVAIISVSCLYAKEYTATWDANTESDLAGYVLFWGPDSNQFAYSADVGNRTMISFNYDGLYVYVSVKAYDKWGNYSGFSKAVFASNDSLLLFDLTGDGILSVADIVEWRLRWVKNPNDSTLDINQNRDVTSTDLVLLRKAVIEYENK